jgi:hypothetical protein
MNNCVARLRQIADMLQRRVPRTSVDEVVVILQDEIIPEVIRLENKYEAWNVYNRCASKDDRQLDLEDWLGR